MADELNNGDQNKTGNDDQQKNVGGDDKGNGDSKGKVEFSPEQQTKVQEIIDETFRKAYAKAAAEKKGGKDEADKDTKKDTSLGEAELKAMKAQVEMLRGEKKTAELLKAISKHNVLDSAEVAELTGRYIRLNEDNTLTVTNANGIEQLNSRFEPMSVDEFVSGWLSARPHHLRASTSQGTGSKGAVFSGDGGSKPMTVETVRGMSIEELKTQMAKGIDIQGSGGQTFKFKDNKNPFAKHN